MRISDWSSDVCSSDLQAIKTFCGVSARVQNVVRIGDSIAGGRLFADGVAAVRRRDQRGAIGSNQAAPDGAPAFHKLGGQHQVHRSEEHTSELQSLMRISYAVFCLKKKTSTVTTEQ